MRGTLKRALGHNPADDDADPLILSMKVPKQLQESLKQARLRLLAGSAQPEQSPPTILFQAGGLVQLRVGGETIALRLERLNGPSKAVFCAVQQCSSGLGAADAAPAGGECQSAAADDIVVLGRVAAQLVVEKKKKTLAPPNTVMPGAGVPGAGVPGAAVSAEADPDAAQRRRRSLVHMLALGSATKPALMALLASHGAPMTNTQLDKCLVSLHILGTTARTYDMPSYEQQPELWAEIDVNFPSFTREEKISVAARLAGFICASGVLKSIRDFEIIRMDFEAKRATLLEYHAEIAALHSAMAARAAEHAATTDPGARAACAATLVQFYNANKDTLTYRRRDYAGLHAHLGRCAALVEAFLKTVDQEPLAP